MRKIVIIVTTIVFFGWIWSTRECQSVSGCGLEIKRELGVTKKSINNNKEEVASFVANKNGAIEKIEIKAGNYGGVPRKISCRITDNLGNELLPSKSSTSFTSSSGAKWREIDYSSNQGLIVKGSTYQIRCKGQDGWNSMYWIFRVNPAQDLTMRVYVCALSNTNTPTPTPSSAPPRQTMTPTPTNGVSPTATVTPTPSNGTLAKKIKIVHFSDIGGEGQEAIFETLKKYNGDNSDQIIFLGSGDYMVYLDWASLNKLKGAVNSFLTETSFDNNDLIMALGNHDDPGRVSTWMWNQTWNNSRVAEDVVVKDNLIIAWMHSEKPDLTMIEEKIKEKRLECPKCVAVMIGHKPVAMKSGMEIYERYMLPVGWRERVLSILNKYNFKFYLTGHFEVHSTINVNGVVHNRATPARRGFEEISFDYLTSGEIKNISIVTRDKNFVGNDNPVPTGEPPIEVSMTPTPSKAPTTGTCYQTCSTNSDCETGQICGRNYNIRSDGAKFCFNWYCSSEPSCVCSWQK